MLVTNLVVNLCIRCIRLMSATRFGEHASIPYSRCGRTKAPYKGMKADLERSWKERLIMKINRLAIVNGKQDSQLSVNIEFFQLLNENEYAAILSVI